MATMLRKWLVTQLIAMLVIGVVTTIALLVLGVKAPFALGIIAGLLEFIPTVGPILSAVPAIAMGFLDSPEKALYVGLAYLVHSAARESSADPAAHEGRHGSAAGAHDRDAGVDGAAVRISRADDRGAAARRGHGAGEDALRRGRARRRHDRGGRWRRSSPRVRPCRTASCRSAVRRSHRRR